jgi:protein-tyrosine kinase
VSLIEKAIEKLRANDPVAPARVGSVGRPVAASSRVEFSSEPATPRRSAPASRIVAIDRAALRAAEYYPQAGSETRFANYYRQIKRPILEKAFTPGEPPESRLVILTSALPGDGKTFTSINLALSMARERDSSVLLIDADIPKPNVSRILGLQSDPGILDALVDETLDPDSLVLRTDVPGLEVLPSGAPVEHASELLTSARMKQIALRLCNADPRRLVLFDAPPLLLSSEARALLTVPGQVVLVVRAGKTPRRAVRDAVELVAEDKLTGLVLNEGRGSVSDGYYYGYGNYGADGSQQGTGTR